MGRFLVTAAFVLAAMAQTSRVDSNQAQTTRSQQLFKRVFGADLLSFDPAAVKRLKEMPEGERLKLDTNGDGSIDTIYFIDNDPKHQAQFRPILVKVVDQDGDMDRDGDGDLDSDLYIADYHGDGSVDAVVEYKDTDHDNGVDEMAIYTYSENARFLGTDAIQVWWSRDLAHTHQLWETVNYRYQQTECQFHSAFGGDEIFSSYIFDERRGIWVPSWENPFAFYDLDGDHLAEAAIRFSGSGSRTESMRYSFDADNDTSGNNVHDYDFSFSCHGPHDRQGRPTIEIPSNLTQRITLRGGPTEPLLAWNKARQFGESANWEKVLLTWVENDNNIDSNPTRDSHERWEGVIAEGNADFPAIGGPTVGIFNSRYELDLKNRSKLRLYLSNVDHRFHLFGAERGWLKVDYNFDGKTDMEFRYRDTNGDGIVDTWEIDYDGDGSVDRSRHISDAKWSFVPRDYGRMTTLYNSVLDDAIRTNQLIIDSMKRVLAEHEPVFHRDAVEEYFADDLADYRGREGIGRKIRDSRAGIRYYQDLIRERYFARICRLLVENPLKLENWRAAYDAGNYERAAAVLVESFPASSSFAADWQAGFEKRLTLRVSNSTSSARVSEAVIIDVANLRKQASDFNADNFAVFSAKRQITDRELPSQADDLDGDGSPDAIVFSTNLRPHETAVVRIYYSPTGRRKRAATSESAVHGRRSGSELLEWTSQKVKYQLSQGHLQFQMELPTGEKMLAPLGGSEDFDVDIGEVKGSPQVFAPYRVNTESVSTRVIADGPVRATVGVGFDVLSRSGKRAHVEERFSTYSGHSYSENHLSIRPKTPQGALWGKVGLLQKRDGENFFDAPGGYFGSWYRQDNATQEVGTGVVLPQSPSRLRKDTRYARCGSALVTHWRAYLVRYRRLETCTYVPGRTDDFELACRNRRACGSLTHAVYARLRTSGAAFRHFESKRRDAPEEVSRA